MSFIYYCTLAQIARLLNDKRYDTSVLDLLKCLEELKRQGLHRSGTC